MTEILLTTNKNIQISNRTLLPIWSDTNSSQNLVEIAGDGSSFVTATDSRFRMYSGDGDLLWDKKFAGGNAQALAYSRDGSTIVIGMDDSSVHVINRYGTELFSAAAENWITSVAVSDDGNTIAFGSMDKKVYVYNHAGAKLGFFPTKSPIRYNSVAVTADGSLIVVVDDSAVYGLSRASFIPAPTGEETIVETTPEPTIVDPGNDCPTDPDPQGNHPAPAPDTLSSNYRNAGSGCATGHSAGGAGSAASVPYPEMRRNPTRGSVRNFVRRLVYSLGRVLVLNTGSGLE